MVVIPDDDFEEESDVIASVLGVKDVDTFRIEGVPGYLLMGEADGHSFREVFIAEESNDNEDGTVGDGD